MSFSLLAKCKKHMCFCENQAVLNVIFIITIFIYSLYKMRITGVLACSGKTHLRCCKS